MKREGPEIPLLSNEKFPVLMRLAHIHEWGALYFQKGCVEGMAIPPELPPPHISLLRAY